MNLFLAINSQLADNYRTINRQLTAIITDNQSGTEKGVFSLEESLESLESLNSLESLEKWSDSPLFSTVWGFSRTSRISKFSRISRKWTFLKRPLFQKNPFSEPESTDNEQLSGTGDSQCDSRESIRNCNPHFYSASGRFA